jgi:hypothetical protein
MRKGTIMIQRTVPTLLALVLVCLLAPVAPGAPAPPPPAKDLPIPKGAPPFLTLARMTKEGNLVTLAHVAVLREQRVTVNRLVNGKQVAEERTVRTTSYEVVEQTMKVKGLQASYADGKKVDAKKLPALLAKRTLVLLADAGPVDPVYLRAFKENLLVLTLPAGPAAPPIEERPRAVPIEKKRDK